MASSDRTAGSQGPKRKNLSSAAAPTPKLKRTIQELEAAFSDWEALSAPKGRALGSKSQKATGPKAGSRADSRSSSKCNGRNAAKQVQASASDEMNARPWRTSLATTGASMDFIENKELRKKTQKLLNQLKRQLRGL